MKGNFIHIIFHYLIGIKHINENREQVLLPLKDELIKKYTNLIDYRKIYQDGSIFQKIKNELTHFYISLGGSISTYLPTMQLLFLEKIIKNFPNHKLILSDFDYLPTMRKFEKGNFINFINLGVLNQPNVQNKILSKFDNKSVSVSYQSILTPAKGSCDIFFPTNFDHMSHLYTKLSNKSVNTEKSSQFMSRYSKIKDVELKNGYNPLLKDYINTSFLYN
jgi:hypothetical protein